MVQIEYRDILDSLVQSIISDICDLIHFLTLNNEIKYFLRNPVRLSDNINVLGVRVYKNNNINEYRLILDTIYSDGRYEEKINEHTVYDLLNILDCLNEEMDFQKKVLEEEYKNKLHWQV